MYQFILLMSVRGLLWGGCCVCTLRNSYQSSEFIYQGLCPGLHTGNNNSYRCSRHTPTTNPPGPPKTPVCQSHNSCPQPFLFPPRPPPRHAHGSDPVLILLLCNCLDDNAQHTIERHGSIYEPSGDNFVYTSHTVPCKVPLMHAHCLNPMHTLLLPISRNSILLLRPNHQILFPGNFYPFMWLQSVRWARKQRDRRRADYGKKSSLSRSRFQAIFPGFISKSSGVENSILKEKWRGGGESWMKKEGGLRGYNPTTSKKASLSPFPTSFTSIISTNADLVQNQCRSWWRCRGFGRWWANCW